MSPTRSSPENRSRSTTARQTPRWTSARGDAPAVSLFRDSVRKPLATLLSSGANRGRGGPEHPRRPVMKMVWKAALAVVITTALSVGSYLKANDPTCDPGGKQKPPVVQQQGPPKPPPPPPPPPPQKPKPKA